MMLKIKYITIGGICGDDFNKKDRTTRVNVNLIVSVSEPEYFFMSLSGDRVNRMSSVVKMTNGDEYYIREDEYNHIISIIDEL